MKRNSSQPWCGDIPGSQGQAHTYRRGFLHSSVRTCALLIAVYCSCDSYRSRINTFTFTNPVESIQGWSLRSSPPTRKFYVSSTSAHRQHNAQSPPHTPPTRGYLGRRLFISLLPCRERHISILGHRAVSGSGRRCSGGLGDAVWIYICVLAIRSAYCQGSGYWWPECSGAGGHLERGSRRVSGVRETTSGS